MKKIVLNFGAFFLVLASVWMAAPPAGAQTGVGSCIVNQKCTNNVSAESCNAQRGTFSEGQSCTLKFTPNSPIPSLFDETTDVDNTLFARYVSAFYIFFAGVAGMLAVVMLMWGGYHYITSAGNSQRMAQGKEIISNAIIGLVLLLTSYLLLNLINPNLVRLTLPSVAVVSPDASQRYYCESTVNGKEAASQQNALCGTKVTYTNEDGKTATCISLAVAPVDQEKDIACFPTSSYNAGGSLVVNYEKLPAKTICEDNKYTLDSSCGGTQAILGLQSWLDGGCKKADVAQTATTGKDVCRYFPFLTCPADWNSQQVCSAAGPDIDSPCWKDDKPRVVDTHMQSVRAHCVDPVVGGKPIQYVDALCCARNKKENTFCVTGATRCNSNEVAVQCASLNSQPGNYLARPAVSGPATCGQSGTICCAPLTLTWSPDDRL